MAEYVRRRWEARFEGMTRRDRQGCEYSAYLPDSLAGWILTVPADLAADMADAENAIRELNRGGAGHVSLEGLARFLLRAESVASSRIEGLEAGPRRLLAAEAVLAAGGDPADRVAAEVMGNIVAMDHAVDLASSRDRLSVDDLLDVHRTLMERSPTPEVGGVIRDRQNWVGGSTYNPCSATYVPPPPERVADLLDDLMRYVDGDEHPVLVQAAIAHAQFETIHPFADGNGRTGRALIHVVLRRRGLVTSFVPPISLVLATRSVDYIAGLTAYRHEGPPTGEERSTASQAWLHGFTAAALRACVDAADYAARIDVLVDGWRTALGRVRRDSAVSLLLDVIPGVPLLTATSAARLIGRSTVATNAAIDRLIEAGILTQRNVGRQRYRVFEVPAVVDLFKSLERLLASPAGDTAVAPPGRPVPRR